MNLLLVRILKISYSVRPSVVIKTAVGLSVHHSSVTNQEDVSFSLTDIF